jgi:phenylacetate-coenzyme A ligase PaaK-like adenylate-forming protein
MMIELTLAQWRFAASLVLGIPFSTRSLDRLIEGLQATRREFGAVGAAGGELLRGPALDDETRRAMQLRRFRAQAGRAARETEYYGALFAQLGLDPARLTWDDVARLPPTPKAALRDRPGAFVRAGAAPTFRATTTGTTGRPTSVSFSEYEMQTYIALATINNLFTGAITDADIVQVSTSARAQLGNTCFMAAARRAGALVYMGGLIDPAQSLALLAEEHALPGKARRATVLLAYPSYLGELVETGRRLGYRPADFGLRVIHTGGEIVTAGLKARARAVFGDVRIEESYGMTETWPATAIICDQGHLHFEPSQGLVEVLDVETGAPTPPGEIGTMVVTPLPPFRETTLVLRYDTQDLVRTLPGPATCALRHLPAVSNLLGKRALAVRHAAGWTTPRDVLEGLEALDAVSLPARCGFWAARDGVAVEVAARDAGPATRRQIAAALEARGVPLRELHVYTHPGQLRHPFPWRGDLKEAMFSTPPPADPAPLPPAVARTLAEVVR